MKWLSFPPIFSLLLILPTVIFHNRESVYHVPPVLWGITISAYICICAISVFYIAKNDKSYNTGIAFLGQGVLLSVLSLQLGVGFFAWLGFTFFLIGLVLIFYYTTRGSISMYEVSANVGETAAAATPGKLVEKVLSKMEIPACVTDNKGIVLSATPKFLEITGKEPENISGEIISDVLPIDDETMSLDSGKWWIYQAKEENRYYFHLSPTEDGMPPAASAAAPAAPARTPSGPSIYDSATSLYTEEYRMIRGPEEVERAQRYKRSLSGLLLELEFNTGSNVNLSDEQQQMLFTAFASRVKATLRNMDCGFLLPERKIQLLLPETPQNGSKTLMSRLVTMPQDVFDDDIREAINPKVRIGQFFYNGTTRMDYAIFSAALEESLLKSKSSANSEAA